MTPAAPLAVARPCLGCGRVTRQGKGSRCPACARAHEARKDKTRGSMTRRGYSSHWLTTVVPAAIRAQPWCSACLTPGTADNPLSGDHVVPLSRGGANTADNCAVLCRVCNGRKGAR